MLKELYIKNLILVKETAVFFKKGLNILTGETGAGKSVIIGSLNLILGERANIDMIRKGENKCSVEAVIDITGNLEIKDILFESGIECEDETVIIKREILIDGNNRQYVNGSSVSLATLKRISSNIFDLHGQHDHQSLFNLDSHRKFLDWYANLKDMVNDLSINYCKYNHLVNRLTEMEEASKKNENDLKLWKYELEEIEKAELMESEEEELEKEYLIISKAKEICEKSYGIYDILYGNDQSMLSGLSTALKQIGELAKYDEFFESKAEICENVIYQIRETAEEIRSHGEIIEYNPTRLAEIEQRMQILERLKRKFSKSLPEIIQYSNELSANIKNIDQIDDQIINLRKEIDCLYNDLVKQSDEISKIRVVAASKLSDKINAEFKCLGMPDAQIKISVEKTDKISDRGFDKIEFMFAANKGESWSSLRKVASGGEISRIMLALKSTFADADNIDVLIFDEIDVNLGGRTARDVGRKLYDLSQKHQVLCITHLPQIASLANSHYKVFKSVIDGRTKTELIELNIDERVDEITRMLGGEDLSSVARIHAKELIEDIKS